MTYRGTLLADQGLWEGELRRADDVCQAVSRLLDRRLYRMLRLVDVLDGQGDDPDRPALLARRLGEYDQVLYEWNDQLNLNLAMMGTYFGESARDWLDLVLYENFRSVGSDLGQVGRRAPQPLLPAVHGLAGPPRVSGPSWLGLQGQHHGNGRTSTRRSAA